MSRAHFGDTATLYHHMGSDVWQRTVLNGVQWRQKIERAPDAEGRFRLQTVTSITIPAEIPAEISAAGLDVFVPGVGPELVEGYTLADLKRDFAGYCTVRAVADNTRRPRLKHRKVMCT